ncbi:MAG: hypothetical protein Ct9H300mP16_11750 [Pseudomonadota bacterium]|nr:MAG: hypothetical protein Ct9H300mP16_11750 [Pseudomonadota bacterium]
MLRRKPNIDRLVQERRLAQPDKFFEESGSGSLRLLRHGPHRRLVNQITEPYPSAGHLVFVGRPYPSPRCADSICTAGFSRSSQEFDDRERSQDKRHSP